MPKQRKLVALQSKHLTKKERMERERAETYFKLSRNGLEPPAWLDDDARQEFLRIVHETEEIDLLDSGDLACLAVYADSYSRYGRAVLEGDAKQLPAIARTILQCSARLGLTATDRLRLIIPEKKAPENKYLKFLKG